MVTRQPHSKHKEKMMRRLMLALAILGLAFYALTRIQTAHAAGTDDQPWYMSFMDWNWLKEQVEHFRSNHDRQTVADETEAKAATAISNTLGASLEEAKNLRKDIEETNGLLQKLVEVCGCEIWGHKPRKMPETGGGGGHHHTTDATATPAPTTTPSCTGSITRWCEDGNTLITTCDGKFFSAVGCHICYAADDKGNPARCDRLADTPTPTAVATVTPVPPTAKPPRPTPTPSSDCNKGGDWVCIGGNWAWVQCGIVWCTTECPLGCSSNPGACKTMVLTPVSLATDTPTPRPWETPVATATKTAVPVYPTATPIEICDGGTPGHLVPCPPTATKTSGPGPSATRTPTGTTAPPWSSPTPIPPTATGLPIATSTKTPGWAIPTATLTGPPTITPISNSLCDVDAPTASKLLSVDGRMHLDPIGNDNCGFKSNSKFGTQFLVRCAVGWICTLDLLGTANGVYISPGKYVVDGDVMSSWTFVIQAGTFRKKSGYWPGDAVHDRCSLLMNERVWGLEPIQGPSFEVWPLGFSCSNPALITTKSGRVCPAFVSSDVPYNTYPLLTEGPNSNGCKLPSQTDQRVGYVPNGWTLNDGTDHPSGSFWQGNEGTLRPQ